MPGCMASMVMPLIYSSFPKAASTHNKACASADLPIQVQTGSVGEGSLVPECAFLEPPGGARAAGRKASADRSGAAASPRPGRTLSEARRGSAGGAGSLTAPFERGGPHPRGCRPPLPLGAAGHPTASKLTRSTCRAFRLLISCPRLIPAWDKSATPGHPIRGAALHFPCH